MSFPECSSVGCKREIITDREHPDYDAGQYYKDGKLKSRCSVCRAKGRDVQKNKRLSDEKERRRSGILAEALKQMMEDYAEAFEIPKHQDKLTVSLDASPCWDEDEGVLVESRLVKMARRGKTTPDESDLNTPNLSGVYDAVEARLFYVLDVNSFIDINASFLRNAEENGARRIGLAKTR